MHHLAVQIVRFVDDHQPGWIACEFQDAQGRFQTLVDKIPIFSEEYFLDEKSGYPRPGVLRVAVLSRLLDAHGQEVVRITNVPDGVESTEKSSLW